MWSCLPTSITCLCEYQKPNTVTAPNSLITLFEKWAGEPVVSTIALPPSGSYRSYFRMSGKTAGAMGVVNNDIKENRAFIEFSRFFKQRGLRVPTVLAVDDDTTVYLLEDFGNQTLFDWLTTTRTSQEIPGAITNFYKTTLQQLIQFQMTGRDLDFSLCYPRASFDKQSMMWDLHYFKYYFLKLARIAFDEQLLEDDFNRFSDDLLQADSNYFMYRDFQSRNIMVVNGAPAFIDYQGGRKGALQYDLASLLYDGKADLPAAFREEMLSYYIYQLSQETKVNEAAFRKYYHGFALIRIMQAMGAYGFRGFYEKKLHFLKSIPFAINNLKYVMQKLPLANDYPMLYQALSDIASSQQLLEIAGKTQLTVTITSFSYKRGIPIDYSGNGGGFVFDCRAIHNPGRYEAYKNLTGKDAEVIAFFAREPEMHEFLENVYRMVNASINKYLSRNFKHLMVNFGCTGGQHRSVYCAEQLAKHLSSTNGVKVIVKHVEQEMRQ